MGFGRDAWSQRDQRLAGYRSLVRGIATGVLSLPHKYMHSPVETFGPARLEISAQLLAAFVKDLAKEGGVPC
ncbi:MAG: hypothetical protein ACLUNZ_02910 [Evtepia sp.]